jgi:SAM-dependent methyltransferase
VGLRFFGSDPETYDAARPGHAAEVYEILRDRCGVGRNTTVLEIGPGTGQATQRLLELGVGTLVAIEPDPALAQYLRATLGNRVEVRVTSLEDAQLEPASFDLAAAASSFHWVDEDEGLDKLFAALRSNSWIALWWTTYGDETRADPFRHAVDPLFENVPSGPSQPTEEGRPSFALDAERRLAGLVGAGFDDPSCELFCWTHAWDPEGIRALYSTFSPIGALPPAERQNLLDSVARIAEDEFGGRVVKPLVTSLYTARKPV